MSQCKHGPRRRHPLSAEGTGGQHAHGCEDGFAVFAADRVIQLAFEAAKFMLRTKTTLALSASSRTATRTPATAICVPSLLRESGSLSENRVCLLRSPPLKRRMQPCHPSGLCRPRSNSAEFASGALGRCGMGLLQRARRGTGGLTRHGVESRAPPADGASAIRKRAWPVCTDPRLRGGAIAEKSIAASLFGKEQSRPLPGRSDF